MKEITVVLFCAIKFAMTFPFAVYGLNMSFWDIILYTNIGGILGLLASVYLSKLVIWLWSKLITPYLPIRKSPKKVFTPRKRRIVLIKKKYGFPGIVVLTPILLSIPVGAFLMTKYYGIRPRNLSWMMLSQIAWSLLYTVFYFYIRTVLINLF